MNKKLIALAAMGLAGFAHAQTHVSLYGTVDTGLVKETGSDLRMDENAANVLGFSGTEELGSGMKATFQLERQFQLYDGTNKATYSLDDSISSALGNRGTVDWTGAANVGLESPWGWVRLGRVNEMSVEYYTEIDPFLQGSTGAALSTYNLLRSEQLSNTIRYDSPEWAGFTFGLTYTLGADTHDKPAGIDSDIYNDGYAASLRFDNGLVFLTANFNRQADSGKSFVWNLGGAYRLGNARISLGYQKSQLKNLSSILTDDGASPLGVDLAGDPGTPVNQEEWLLGFQYAIGAGTINASYNRASLDKTARDGNVNKYALGYTCDLSKRTQLYGVVSYTDSDNEYVGSLYNNNGAARDSVTGVQLGITHTF